MSKSIHHELNKPSSLISLFSKALKPKGKINQNFPSITTSLKSLKADKNKVKAYSKVCGLNKSKTLTVT